MTAGFMYDLIIFISNKNNGQGYITPDEFNVIINQSRFSFLDYLLGEFQQYQGGRPVPRVQFGMNESVRQRLTPFINAPVTLNIDVAGLSPYPGDYQQSDAMYDSSMNRIRYVPQHKLYSYLKSQIDPISTKPIYLIESDGFRFYPNTTYNGVDLGTAKLSYVHTPPDIVYSTIPDGNGRPVYDPGTSVDPEWYDVDCLDILARALRMIGVNL